MDKLVVTVIGGNKFTLSAEDILYVLPVLLSVGISKIEQVTKTGTVIGKIDLPEYIHEMEKK